MTLTLAETYAPFLDDLAHKSQLRPSTIRAYQYELAAAAQDSRFQIPLQALKLDVIEDWIGRGIQRPAPAAGGQPLSTASSSGQFSKRFVNPIR